MRVSYQPVPMQWWGKTAVIRNRDGSDERIIVIRLSSWGMGYAINRDEMCWGQRVLMYRGRGSWPGLLSLSWYFPEEGAD